LRVRGNAEAENGRGLAVVNHLSEEWGYFSRLSRKVVYAELRMVPRLLISMTVKGWPAELAGMLRGKEPVTLSSGTGCH
jgi:hypothetical protein